jgi:hypothetical protein
MRLKVPASAGLAGCCGHSPWGSGRSGSGELNIIVNSPGPLDGGGAGGRPGSGIGDFGESWNTRENSPGGDAAVAVEGAPAEGAAGLAGGALNETGASTGCWAAGGGSGTGDCCVGGRAPVWKRRVNSPGPDAPVVLVGDAGLNGVAIGEAAASTGCWGSGGSPSVRPRAWNMPVSSPGAAAAGTLGGNAGLAVDSTGAGDDVRGAAGGFDGSGGGTR